MNNEISNTLYKICKIVLIGIIVCSLYICVGSLSSKISIDDYDEINSSQNYSESKKLFFLKRYVEDGGKVSYNLVEQGDPNIISDATGNSDIQTSGTVTDTDIREIAKVVASAYNGKYDQSAKVSVTYKGKTVISRLDCSGFVSSMLTFMEVRPDSLTNSYGFYDGAGGTKIGEQGWSDGIQKFGDLKVGDILVVRGHVEIITYIEGDNIYVGNCGGDDSIVSTATKGYCRITPANTSLNNWDSKGRAWRVYRF